MGKFKRGDTVCVEGRIHGARVVKVSKVTGVLRVTYHCPREGKVTRWVSPKEVTR